ncbi:MAG TPA: FG-GAP-like repeat-containing protein [Agriterribacter sp.]|nr:FG-GAP-like repeat-containing protein [Agriterribacter sp.]
MKVKLQGAGKNSWGIGSKVSVYAGGQVHELYQMLSRGFQSSVDPVITVGLGNNEHIDSLVIVWPDMKKQTVKDVHINTTLVLKQEEATEKFVPQPAAPALYSDVTAKWILGESAHRENLFVDFDRERLMPKMVSMEGPECAVADVNGDGLDDIFIGGAKSDKGKLFLQQANGVLVRSLQKIFDADNSADQTGCVFFDADKDGDNDLLIVYGGNEDKGAVAALRPRLLLNDGKGNFTDAPQNLPVITTTASCVRVADMDGDGDMDIFIGGRVLPGEYGLTPASFLLINDGRGNFTEETDRLAPGLKKAGMVTDARWADTDNDGMPELIIAGDWMPVTIFKNTGGKLIKTELPASAGWWNSIQAADLNGDGYVDFVIGNLGLNSKIKGDVAHPVELYVKDFDKNGQTESVLCYYKSDSISYPLPLRGDMVMQIPGLKKKFLKYADYAGKTIHQVFSEQELEGALIRKAEQFNTCIALNDGKGNFTLQPLPLEAQFSPVYGILTADLDGDGLTDILLGGNFFGVKPEIGRYDASYSCFLKGDGKGNYSFVPNAGSGMIVKGEVKNIVQLHNKNGSVILFIKNNDVVQVFKKNPKP